MNDLDIYFQDEHAQWRKDCNLLCDFFEREAAAFLGRRQLKFMREFKEGKLTRQWQKQTEIESWLDSWQDVGLQDNIKDFCEKVIHDYYYFEDFWIKWRFWDPGA